VIEHEAVVHNALIPPRLFKLDSGARTLQFATSTFDVFALDLFMALFSGGCVALVPTTTILADMTGFLRDSRITYTQLTPW